MKIQQKIEVMQAYERGEQIQRADIGSNKWLDTYPPSWDWERNNYRVKPKGDKFKIGDTVVCLDSEELTLFGGDIYKIIGVGALWYELQDLCGIEIPIDFGPMNEKYINTDSVLWYWEYQDNDGVWHKTGYRAIRAEIEKLNNFSNFTPLYALGFRLPQKLKDTK